MIKIVPLSAFNDNYIWVGINPVLAQAFVVDPGDATPVQKFLSQRKLTLVAILLTHKHNDHVGGVAALKQQFPAVPVYAHAHENIPEATSLVTENDKINFPGWQESFTVMEIPGHTVGHIAYFNEAILFCGDTLFAAGCGRVFEGTMEQMYVSLQRLQQLPDQTLMYCGHEYTLANLKFAQTVEPDNVAILQRLQAIEKLRQQNLPSLPASLYDEKATNPFLRCEENSVHKSAEIFAGKNLGTAVEVFAQLRTWKNQF